MIIFRIALKKYAYELFAPGIAGRWNSEGKKVIYDEMKTTILKVPSAIVSQEHNYVLHNFHPDFSKIKIIDVTEFIPDERIDDILKNYRLQK